MIQGAGVQHRSLQPTKTLLCMQCKRTCMAHMGRVTPACGHTPFMSKAVSARECFWIACLKFDCGCEHVRKSVACYQMSLEICECGRVVDFTS